MTIGRLNIYSYRHWGTGFKIDNYSKDDFYGKGRSFRFDISFGCFSVVIQLFKKVKEVPNA